MTQTAKCYFCESTERIEEHHILPQRFDGSDMETNTVDVCHECHWKLERLYNKDFWNAIGVDDPRATKESHVTCEYKSCLNQSKYRYGTSAGIIHRCEEHQRDPSGDTNTGNDTELKSLQKYVSSE